MAQLDTSDIERRLLAHLISQAQPAATAPMQVDLSLPVRVDLSPAGVSDTPPLVWQRPAAAVSIAGNVHPGKCVRVSATPTADAMVRLQAGDTGVTWTSQSPSPVPSELRVLREVLRAVADALHCRAMELPAIVGHGISLRTASDLAYRSGLGVSSILLRGAVEATCRVLGLDASQEWMNAVMLLAEARMGGGGWEDSMVAGGGCVWAVSLPPDGLPFSVWLDPPVETLEARLRLVQLPTRRRSRTFLRRTMARALAGDRSTVYALDELVDLAAEVAQLLVSPHLNTVVLADALNRQWLAWCRATDGECTNSLIEGFRKSLGRSVAGFRVCGAGGGGYALVLLDDGYDEVAAPAAIVNRFSICGRK